MTWRPSANLVTMTATIVVCVLLYVVASYRYHHLGFFTLQVFLDLFRDNAYLGIAAVGMTFVILSGGIDLSVGAVVGLTGITLGMLMERHGWHPVVAVALVLALGTIFGAVQGFMIHTFQLAPFFVTLAGMFFARGVALLVSTESIGLVNERFLKVSDLAIPLGTEGGHSIPFVTIAFVAVAAIGMYLARWTRFGRFTYAIGGNEQSAVLMGLPVARTKVLVYVYSGFCSALAGVIWSMQYWSGKATAAEGMELDAIAAVVLGGTLLSGGIGSVLGTVVGVMILAIIGQIVTLENLTSWWTRIAVGVLLLLFIVMQKLLTRLGAVRAA
jgi:ribose/xylose/arabinose/galactoside ABC-type transport system permease subunit